MTHTSVTPKQREPGCARACVRACAGEQVCLYSLLYKSSLMGFQDKIPLQCSWKSSHSFSFFYFWLIRATTFPPLEITMETVIKRLLNNDIDWCNASSQTWKSLGFQPQANTILKSCLCFGQTRQRRQDKEAPSVHVCEPVHVCGDEGE